MAACQTGHPRPDPARIAEPVLPAPQTPAAPSEDLRSFFPSEEPIPAAIDPNFTPGPADASADTAWIDALLQLRAPDLGRRERAAVATQVASASDLHGLDPLVVLSIIAQESRFDPDARGVRSAVGLMQIRPFVARDVARRHHIPWHGESTLLDPAQNVAIGTAYLGEILQQFGDLELALAGYNMGPYRLQRMLARGAAPEGEYLGRILTHYADLAGLAAALETGVAPCAEVDC
jgi:soluble lytic murein transglycosylase-like protein